MSTTPPIDPGTLPVTGYQLTSAMQAIGQQIADMRSAVLAANPPTLANLALRAERAEAQLKVYEELFYGGADQGLLQRVTALEAEYIALSLRVAALEARVTALTPPPAP